MGIGHGIAGVDEAAQELAEGEAALAGVTARLVRRMESAGWLP